MTGDRLRPAALAREVLLPPVLAGAVVVGMLCGLAGAKTDGGSHARSALAPVAAHNDLAIALAYGPVARPGSATRATLARARSDHGGCSGRSPRTRPEALLVPVAGTDRAVRALRLPAAAATCTTASTSSRRPARRSAPPASGSVAVLESIGESAGYGNFVCLQHRPDLATCYAHLSAVARPRPPRRARAPGRGHRPRRLDRLELRAAPALRGPPRAGRVLGLRRRSDRAALRRSRRRRSTCRACVRVVRDRGRSRPAPGRAGGGGRRACARGPARRRRAAGVRRSAAPRPRSRPPQPAVGRRRPRADAGAAAGPGRAAAAAAAGARASGHDDGRTPGARARRAAGALTARRGQTPQRDQYARSPLSRPPWITARSIASNHASSCASESSGPICAAAMSTAGPPAAAGLSHGLSGHHLQQLVDAARPLDGRLLRADRVVADVLQRSDDLRPAHVRVLDARIAQRHHPIRQPADRDRLGVHRRARLPSTRPPRTSDSR